MKNFKQLLEALHEQLSQIDDFDAAETELLRQSADEIQTALDQDDADSASLGKRHHDATDRFRESHPILTKTAGRIADTLACCASKKIRIFRAPPCDLVALS